MKPARSQALNQVLAADLGGTHIRAASVRADGHIAVRVQRPTPAADGAEAVVAALAEALDAVLAQCPPNTHQAVGLSLAGVIDADTTQVLDATDALPGWKGTHLRAALQPRWGLPVVARNDVHAALLGEAWLGGLRGAQRGALLTLGTGLGGAWMAESKLQTGAHQLAGHWGRTEVLLDGERVSLDQLVSGSGLAAWHRRLGGNAPHGHAVLAALATDPRARSALAHWTEHLALLLHNLHWALDPGLVLLGGGLIDARAHWWEGLHARLGPLPLTVQPATLGGQAGLLGAAWLALQAALESEGP